MVMPPILEDLKTVASFVYYQYHVASLPYLPEPAVIMYETVLKNFCFPGNYMKLSGNTIHSQNLVCTLSKNNIL